MTIYYCRIIDENKRDYLYLTDSQIILYEILRSARTENKYSDFSIASDFLSYIWMNSYVD